MANMLRVALIGKTGVGKSALGNTLLGEQFFKSSVAGQSVTTLASARIGKLSDGKMIKVVDTPGIMDTKGKEELVRKEVTKVIAYLSPGPHAFIIVLKPERMTKEEREVIRDLQNLFGDVSFLDHAIIVMVKKNDLKDENRKQIEIHDYINNYAADDLKDLYEKCGKRIVAVENHAEGEELQSYIDAIVSEIGKFDGSYFSHEYFKVMQILKDRDDEISQYGQKIRRLQEKLETEIKVEGNEMCAIL